MTFCSPRTAFFLNLVLLLNLGVTYWLLDQPHTGPFLDGLGYFVYGFVSLCVSALINLSLWLHSYRQDAPQAARIYGIAALLYVIATAVCFLIVQNA
ncbi:hypothetical protein GCM10022409_19910 [Hymenobacter glaciei]|uniref:Uncharacterized protein n=1 Tax=Hymenobacter glaciei TaxID=877209 RepID=A0ABP7U3K5_9BACT